MQKTECEPQQQSQSHTHTQMDTDLNCMTELCWLKRVMTHTSMKGLGSEKKKDRQKLSQVLQQVKQVQQVHLSPERWIWEEEPGGKRWGKWLLAAGCPPEKRDGSSD